MSGESDFDDNIDQEAIEMRQMPNQTNSKIHAQPYFNPNDQPKYTIPQRQRVMNYSFDAGNLAQAQRKDEPSCKVYFVAGYRIIIHLLLIYCVFGVSYLLFIDECDKCNDDMKSTSTMKSDTHTTTLAPFLTTSATSTLIPNSDVQSIQTTLFEINSRITQAENNILAVNTSLSGDINALMQKINDLENNSIAVTQSLSTEITNLNSSFRLRMDLVLNEKLLTIASLNQTMADINTLFILMRTINATLYTATPAPVPQTTLVEGSLMPTYDIDSIQTTLFEIESRTTEVENDIHSINQSLIEDIANLLALITTVNASVPPNSDIASIETTLFEMDSRITEVETDTLAVNNSLISDMNTLTLRINDLDINSNMVTESLSSEISNLNSSFRLRMDLALNQQLLTIASLNKTMADIDTLFKLMRTINATLYTATPAPVPQTTSVESSLMPTYDIDSIQTTLFEIESRTTEVENGIQSMNQSLIEDIANLLALIKTVNASVPTQNRLITPVTTTMSPTALLSSHPSVYPTIEPTMIPTFNPTYGLYFEKDYFTPERLVYFFSHAHDMSTVDDPYGPYSDCASAGTCHSAVYYHIITPLPRDCNTMYRFTIRGYLYGARKPLDLLYMGYPYSSTLLIHGSVTVDLHDILGVVKQYIGSNGTVVLKFGPINRYFNGFALYYQGYSNDPEVGLRFGKYITKATIGDVEI